MKMPFKYYLRAHKRVVAGVADSLGRAYFDPTYPFRAVFILNHFPAFYSDEFLFNYLRSQDVIGDEKP